MRTRNIILIALLAILAFLAIIWLAARPSNDRDWRVEQSVLARSEIDGDILRVQNIRNFTYRSMTDFDAHYYNATYNLSDLRSAEYAVEPFTSIKGVAHTFVTFGFADGRRLAVSVEARKEKHETYGSLSGLLRQYELIYVVGDEQDLIKERTNFERDTMYLYPLNLTQQQARGLLVDMLGRANALAQRPEFYNTATSSCTTNLIDHLNRVQPDRLRKGLSILLPGFSDRYLYEQHLINTTLPFEQAQLRYRIDLRAQKYGDSPEFSERIREFDETQ